MECVMRENEVKCEVLYVHIILTYGGVHMVKKKEVDESIYPPCPANIRANLPVPRVLAAYTYALRLQFKYE